MKTTRIDTSNEIDEFNITALLTTTPKYDSTTFPFILVTEKTKPFDNLTTPQPIETPTSTMFPVIVPESTTHILEPVTKDGTTVRATQEIMESITVGPSKEIPSSDLSTTSPYFTTESVSTIKPQILKDLTTTMFPVITEKVTELSEVPGTTTSLNSIDMVVETTATSSIDNITNIGGNTNTTTKPITTIIPSISTTTPSSLITVINTTCTDHTNCAPNQLCILGQCRFKCRGDGTNESNCVKGTIFINRNIIVIKFSSVIPSANFV